MNNFIDTSSVHGEVYLQNTFSDMKLLGQRAYTFVIFINISKLLSVEGCTNILPPSSYERVSFLDLTNVMLPDFCNLRSEK